MTQGPAAQCACSLSLYFSKDNADFDLPRGARDCHELITPEPKNSPPRSGRMAAYTELQSPQRRNGNA